MDSKKALVAVMGPTGAGKSSFIAGITGSDAGVCRTLHSGTKSITGYRLDLSTDSTITLVDTPGFDDTFSADHDTLQEVADWLTTEYDKGQLLSGILYLQPITKNRIEGSTRRCLSLFEKLCGPQNLKNVVLVTTFWNDVDKQLGIQREKELVETAGLWKELKDRGATVARMGRDYGQFCPILQELIKKPVITLQLQEEIHGGKLLAETLAGLHLNSEMEKMQKEHEQKAQSLQDDFKRRLDKIRLERQMELDRLKREQERWEELELQRLQEEQEVHEARLRRIAAEHERREREQQERLERLAREAAEKEAEIQRQRAADAQRQKETEERRKLADVLVRAQNKWRVSIWQEEELIRQLNAVRRCLQSNSIRFTVMNLAKYGNGRQNADMYGNPTNSPVVSIQTWCDICRKAQGTRRHFACTKLPCPVAGDGDMRFYICNDCWSSDHDWRLLDGATCKFELTLDLDFSKRARNPNGLVCNICRSTWTMTREIEGLYFHCSLCTASALGREFDICLRCAQHGYTCGVQYHPMIWGVQRVEFGNGI